MFALADGDVASESSSVRVANTANVGVAWEAVIEHFAL